MAKSRACCSHRTPQPPPPPYEAGQIRMGDPPDHEGGLQQSTNIGYAPRAEHQTIPKTAHPSEHQSGGMMSGYASTACKQSNSKTGYNYHKRHIEDFDEHRPRLPCAHSSPSRKRSFASSVLPARNHHDDNQEQFVRSLAASKSFIGKISVEPFAFLVIVALYIEFPAIQDLIWTKICLEVVAKHPRLGQPHGLMAGNLSTTPSQGSPGHLNGSLLNLTLPGLDTIPLPADGRIQQAIGSSPMVQPGTPQATIDSSSRETDHRRQHSYCDRLKRNVPSDIRQEIIDTDSLFWLKYQILICSLCLLASPYWGGLSDKIGRLIPMEAPVVAAILCNAISLIFGLLISMNSHSLFHIEWLYVGALIVGLSGGQTVLIMNMFSFISDNTTSEERSRRVTVLESVIFIAHSFGFFLSKMIMLLGLDPPDRPWLNRHFVAFGSCVLLNLVGFVYSMAKLRHHKFHRFMNNFEREQQEAAILGSAETLGAGVNPSGPPGVGRDRTDPAAPMGSCERLRELTSPTPDDPDGPIARSDKSNWSFRDTMITFRYYRETYEIATKKRDSRTIILLLLLSGFISSLSLAALMSLFFIYVKMDPFNWSTSQYSYWNSISAITRGFALVSLSLMMRFASFWSVPDPFVAALGFLAKGAGLLTIGLAHASAHLNWALLALTFSEYSMPPIRSLLSKLVVREELCKIYSCLGASQSFCFILGNIAFYAALTIYTDAHLFRLSFLVVAGIEFGAVVLLLVIYGTIRQRLPHILL